MLGKSLISSSLGSPSEDRVFIYEVTGLKQNDKKDSNRYPFRTSSSSSIFLKVPYSQMNKQMRRIALLGGKIVNISPLEASESNNSDD